MLKKWLAVVAVFTSLFAFERLRLQHHAVAETRRPNAAWSEVLNQISAPRRFDSESGQHGKRLCHARAGVFTQVTGSTRSKVGSIQMSAEDAADPEKLQQFQQAQGNLSSALSPPAGGFRKLSGIESRPEFSAIYRRSLRARGKPHFAGAQQLHQGCANV